MDITLIKTKGNLFFRKIKTRNDLNDLNCDGFLIDSDEKEIRRIIDVLNARGEKKKIAVIAKNDEFNRRVIETCKINFLVGPESNEGKDGLKQRSSGLNHVVAKLAKEKGIDIVIHFSQINKLDKKQKAIAFSRIIQNIKICRKAGCKIKIFSFAESEKEIVDSFSLKSFGFSLGMSSQQVKSLS